MEKKEIKVVEVNWTAEDSAKARSKIKRAIEVRISNDYKLRAAAELNAGGRIEVNTSLPYIAIDGSDGLSYFFQGEEAENLIKEYESVDWLECTLEEYLLAISQNW